VYRLSYLGPNTGARASRASNVKRAAAVNGAAPVAVTSKLEGLPPGGATVCPPTELTGGPDGVYGEDSVV
jgi:hypothetical protein